MKKMCRAYAIADTPEAAVRKLTIKMLTQAAGRTSEVAWLALSGMSWDAHFNCVVVLVPQSKTSKIKYIAFCAGVDRHSDSGKDEKMETLAGKFAPDFFLRIQRHGVPHMNKQNVELANQLMEWFNGMATAEEREVLNARVEQKEESKRIVANLQACVKERLEEAYLEVGYAPDDVPDGVRTKKKQTREGFNSWRDRHARA